jgi:hypothetical protein
MAEAIRSAEHATPFYPQKSALFPRQRRSISWYSSLVVYIDKLSKNKVLLYVKQMIHLGWTFGTLRELYRMLGNKCNERQTCKISLKKQTFFARSYCKTCREQTGISVASVCYIHYGWYDGYEGWWNRAKLKRRTSVLRLRVGVSECVCVDSMTTISYYIKMYWTIQMER